MATASLSIVDKFTSDLVSFRDAAAICKSLPLLCYNKIAPIPTLLASVAIINGKFGSYEFNMKHVAIFFFTFLNAHSVSFVQFQIVFFFSNKCSGAHVICRFDINHS